MANGNSWPALGEVSGGGWLSGIDMGAWLGDEGGEAQEGEIRRWAGAG